MTRRFRELVEEYYVTSLANCSFIGIWRARSDLGGAEDKGNAFSQVESDLLVVGWRRRLTKNCVVGSAAGSINYC